MEWDEYKRLCDSPQTFSRWMLEQCLELLSSEMRLRTALGETLRAAPLDKPRDHRGSEQTDMFEVMLAPDDARAIHGIISGPCARDAQRAEHDRAVWADSRRRGANTSYIWNGFEASRE